MNYQTLLSKIEDYKRKFDVLVIGETLHKRKIFAVERNVKPNLATAIFVASVHARENVTTDLLCKFLDDGLFDDVKDFNLSFILMANPDGVEISKNGVYAAPFEQREFLIDLNQGSFDFSLWKANGRGVDINNNFDANFKSNIGSLSPAPSGFAGKFAESEIETKSLVLYTKLKNVFFTVSYHTKGEEIYYNFFQSGKALERDKIIAEKFAESTGYIIKNPELVSSGGYKDFCVQKLKIPAITIEVGNDSLVHPISEKYLNSIFDRNKNIANDTIFAYNTFERFRENELSRKVYEEGD